MVKILANKKIHFSNFVRLFLENQGFSIKKELIEIIRIVKIIDKKIVDYNFFLKDFRKFTKR